MLPCDRHEGRVAAVEADRGRAWARAPVERLADRLPELVDAGHGHSWPVPPSGKRSSMRPIQAGHPHTWHTTSSYLLQ